MNNEDSVPFMLTKPVKYGPENKETDFVEIRCPAYDNGGSRKYRRDLRAMLSSIIIEESKGVGKGSASEQEEMKEGELPFTPGQVMLTVSAALGEDYSKAIDNFSERAKDFCFLGGEEAVKSGTLARMWPDDVEMMFATFIANFIMPSLLKSLIGNEG